MPTYLLEAYSVSGADALAVARERAVNAAVLGADVRYLRTTYLPSDETLLHFFEATSRDSLRNAAQLAALAYERIVETVEGSDGR